MKAKINHLLGAVLSLLVTFGLTHRAVASERIVFYSPVIVTNVAPRTHTVFYTTNSQIRSMDVDGTDVRQLTAGTEDCLFPRWRPGQTHILFHRGGTLYVMDANGAGTFAVATARGDGADWSPDGKRICYLGNDAIGWSGILVASVDPAAKGKNKVGTPVMVRRGSAYGPAWSPDGKKLAFSSYPTGGTPYITVFDLTTGAETTLNSLVGLLPSWSPTGEQIAFTGVTAAGDWELFIMNADFSGNTQVTNFKSVLWPTWSPDGAEVAFRIGSGKGWEASIYKLTLGTGDLTLLQEKADHADWKP